MITERSPNDPRPRFTRAFESIIRLTSRLTVASYRTSLPAKRRNQQATKNQRNTGESALDQFTPDECEKLDYEIWNEDNQPLKLPLHESQIESDKQGCL